MGEEASGGVPAVAGLYAKLAEVLGAVGYVQKRGRNDFHRYSYVTEEDLLKEVRAELSKRKVIVIPSTVHVEERPIKTSKGADSCITNVTIDFVFCDGDSGATHTATFVGAGDDPADKGVYKAYTGAMKYFLSKSFMIPTGDDPEADKGTDARSQAGQSRTPTQVVPAQHAEPNIAALEFFYAAIQAANAKALTKAEWTALLAKAHQSEDGFREAGLFLRETLTNVGGDPDATMAEFQRLRAAA